MAEQPGQEKTELATPRRRKKALEQGQVAKSQELSSFMILLSGLMVLSMTMPKLSNGLFNIVRGGINSAFSTTITTSTFPVFGGRWVADATSLVLPLFTILVVVSLAVNFAQVGFHANIKLLAPKPNRISILAGVKRMFGKRNAFELAKGLVKLGVLFMITWMTLKQEQGRIIGLSDVPIESGLGVLGFVIAKLAGRLILMMVVLALADYAFQRWQHEHEIMMTKQELKDEYKETEGDPLLKSRLKALQREVATRRMMEDVKEADVVVTNPTHYAVALKYEDGMGAPTMLAKGKNEVARRIREIAREAGIPIVEDPPLARALYAEVKIGTALPLKFFQTVAELLAYVYRMKETNKGWS